MGEPALSDRSLRTAAWLSPLVVFLAVYGPTVGHGFIKDDVSWILSSRVRSLSDVLHLFQGDNGFYRPIVSLVFAINELLAGAQPWSYGITNMLLALLCAGSLVWLGRGLRMSIGAALLAGGLWLLNFNGIGGSMLWISGRTYLVVTLAAVLTANALMRGHLAWATALLTMALFAKEEALLLPAILLAWLVVLKRSNGDGAGVRVVPWILAATFAVCIYVAARSLTHAMTPLTAPPYYRPTFAAGALSSNALHYADWALTFSTAVTLIGVALLGVPRPFLDTRARAIVLSGAMWLVGEFAITVFVPSRSVLYACLPSVGVALAAAALCERAWSAAAPVRRRRALVVAATLPVLLSPIYHARTQRMVAIADLSAQTLGALPALTAGLPDGSTIVIEDDRSQKSVNLEAAFGTLLNEAYRLTNHRSMRFWIEPAVTNAAAGGLTPPCATCVNLRLAIRSGHLKRVD